MHAQMHACMHAPVHLHFQDPVPLGDAGPVCSAPGQHGADVLQRRVQLPVDAPELAPLAHLAPHIEAVARVGLDDPDQTRARGHGGGRRAAAAGPRCSGGAAGARRGRGARQRGGRRTRSLCLDVCHGPLKCCMHLVKTGCTKILQTLAGCCGLIGPRVSGKSRGLPKMAEGGRSPQSPSESAQCSSLSSYFFLYLINNSYFLI